MKLAYVGCRTTRERNARGKGLKVYAIDETTAIWTEIQLLSELENPSYLAFDRTQEYLYVVHGDRTEVSSFKIHQATGKLEYLNTVDSGGNNPVFLMVDRTNRYCFVANLLGGTIATLPRNMDGSLSAPIHVTNIPGKDEGSVSHPHQCLIDSSMAYVFVPAQGRKQGFGQLDVFKISEDGSLEKRCCVKSRAGAEPRHAAIHANGRYVYLVNERDNTIAYYQFRANIDSLEPKQILSTLPEYYAGDGEASTVVIHPSANFLYVANRVHNSIAIYAIDEHTGYLRNVGFESTLGQTPRFITMDDTGDYLYVANEDSDQIVVFRVNPLTGGITYTGQTISTESPVCILMFQI